MRIIRTIIFCASMVVYSSTTVRASVNNNQIGGLSNNPDATLIEKNQNRFEFGPQTLSLELPDAGSVSVKNFPKLANVTFITGDKQLDFGNVEFVDPYDQICKSMGYAQTSCAAGYWKFDFCRYSNAYFKQCCADKYKYTADSCSYPNELSSAAAANIAVSATVRFIRSKAVCHRRSFPEMPVPKPVKNTIRNVSVRPIIPRPVPGKTNRDGEPAVPITVRPNIPPANASRVIIRPVRNSGRLRRATIVR